MSVWEFVVWTVPVAQPRHRSAPLGHRDKSGHFHPKVDKWGKPIVVNYDDNKHPVVQFKADVRRAAQDMGVPYHEGLFKLDITAYFPRPKKLMRKKDPDGPVLYDKKPDRDNLDKSVMDSLEGLAFKNDCMANGGQVLRWYCAKPGYEPPLDRPHVRIRLEHLQEEQDDYEKSAPENRQGSEVQSPLLRQMCSES